MAIDEMLIGDRTFNPLPAMERRAVLGELYQIIDTLLSRQMSVVVLHW